MKITESLLNPDFNSDYDGGISFGPLIRIPEKRRKKKIIQEDRYHRKNI